MVANTSASRIVLPYLRYMLSTARLHCFRRMTIELGIWESTISRGIRDLEDVIGVALFTCHPGGPGVARSRPHEPNRRPGSP